MSFKHFYNYIAENNAGLTQAELIQLKTLSSELFKLLKSMSESGRLKDDTQVMTDFNFIHHYQSDKYDNPDYYFNFRFGVVSIEIVKRRNNCYSVRSFNYRFSDDCLNKLETIFKNLNPVLTFSERAFISGWSYVGSFPRSMFADCVKLFRHLVFVFLSSLGDYAKDIYNDLSYLECF